MAGTLIARELHKAHGAATILAGVSVTVAPGDVLGVVGPNGAGKSTLLRMLAGIDRPDRGTVRLTAGAAGYLPQEPDRAPGERLHDYLARRTGVAAADARVHEATDAMAAEAPGAAEAYAHAFEGWLALGGADLEPRAETVLRDLGLDPALLELETAALSGGAGRARRARRDPALALRRPAARRAHQRPRLRRPRAARALRRRAPGRRRDRLPRPRVPRAHGHARARDRRDRGTPPRSTAAAGPATRSCARRPPATPRSATRPTRPQRDRLTDRARRQRQWSETGVRKAKASDEPDKNVRRARTERSEKQASEGARRPRRRSSASTRSTSRGGAGSCSCASAAASAPAT